MSGNERFMPPGYAEKLHVARRERAMRGERRIITMLFCDVVGSTAMEALFADRLAEEAHQLAHS